MAIFSEVRIHHVSKPIGEFKSSIDMVNFTLSDPLHIFRGTLYNEILGLKHDSRNSSSILHLKLESFPRPSISVMSEVMTEPGVHLNSETLNIDAFDSLLSLHFSPMRFVYLQQLWMEIIDYIFEGIIGYEIFGKERPKPSAEANVMNSNTFPTTCVFYDLI